MHKRKYWTPEEDEQLRELFPHYYTNEIAEMLNVKRSSVSHRAYKLGLKKSPETLRRMMEDLKLKHPNAGCFTAGMIPHNKGKKVPVHVYEAMSKSFFKKGQVPHNSRPIGTISERADKFGVVYIYIKTESGKWELLHRHNWEQIHGPITKGNRIHFIDGNTRNCDISNLKMMTGSEAMLKNSIVKYPPEIRDIIKLNNKIKSKLQ